MIEITKEFGFDKDGKEHPTGWLNITYNGRRVGTAGDHVRSIVYLWKEESEAIRFQILDAFRRIDGEDAPQRKFGRPSQVVGDADDR